MDKETVLAEKIPVTEAKRDTKPETQSTQTAEYPQIKEAVSRAVREYGEALKKLAKND